MSNDNLIIKQILDAIDDKTLDLKNVPELEKVVKNYANQSKKQIDDVTNDTLNKIRNMSKDEFSRYENSIERNVNKHYQKLINQSNELDAKNQKILNEHYQRLINNLNDDKQVQNIKNSIVQDMSSNANSVHALSTSVDKRIDILDKKINKLQRMTYFKRFKSIISVFVGVAVPILVGIAMIVVFIGFLVMYFTD